MTETIHLALTHKDEEILVAGTSFLDVFKAAPVGTFLTTEVWLTSGRDRKAELLAAVNLIYAKCWDCPGQRVDLAIGELRRLGVKSEWYTSRLLRESSYGRLPVGSVAGFVIAVGESDK